VTRAVSPSAEASGLAATGFDSQAFGIAGLLLVVMGVLARRFSAIRNR
jgi:LPXTG-motif cell wall-anchored protein